MKIQTTGKLLEWREKLYQIDHNNQLAFTPSQIRDAGLCYRNLVRRGEIKPEDINMVSPKRRSFLRRFIGNACAHGVIG